MRHMSPASDDDDTELTTTRSRFTTAPDEVVLTSAHRQILARNHSPY